MGTLESAAGLPDPINRPCVALIPWGHTIDEFLDSIGVTFDQFCEEMNSGWLFGYARALQMSGFEVVILCFSQRVESVKIRRHALNGATIGLLPAGKPYRFLRRWVSKPYAWTRRDMFRGSRLPRPLQSLIRDAIPYTVTPRNVLKRTLEILRVDTVICQEYEYPRFDVMTTLGREMRLPVFATCQGGDWQMSRWERFTRPRAIRRCAGLIVAPSAEAERVSRVYNIDPQRIARIPNPLDVDEWHPEPREACRMRFDIPLESRVVIWHGRVDIHPKGLDILLDAWRTLRARHRDKDWRLVLFGTGPAAARLRDRLREQADASITWIDLYTREVSELRSRLSAADFYVMASRHEGYPVAPVEAMACGLPVVATDVSGISDIMGAEPVRPGHIVPVGDHAALADAMEIFLDDPAACDAAALMARPRAMTFSLKHVGDQLNAFLSKQGAPVSLCCDTKSATERRLPTPAY